jgi:integrase
LIALTPANCNVLREHQTKQEQDRRSLYSENCPKCHKNNWNRNEAGALKCLDCENVIPTIKDEDLVFCHFDGKPYLPDSITHVWMMLVRRNGLTGTRLHDIRHSHASLLLKQGIHPKIVQERLGHATISTTLDLYSHVAPGLQAAAAAKFDDILKPKETKLEKELKEVVGQK